MRLMTTFEQFAAIRQFTPSVAYSPDGERLAYIDNTSGQMNLWMIGRGGCPRQITAFTDHAVRDFAWSPDSQRIVFFADHDSDERHQIYLLDVPFDAAHPDWGRVGYPKCITDAGQAQHLFIGKGVWSPDGKWIAYSANDGEDPSLVHLILHNIETDERRRPKRPDARYYPVAWSPDGQDITLLARRPGLDTDVVLLHVSGDHVNITNHYGNTIKCMPGPWLPDNSGFFMLLDIEKEYMGIARYGRQFGRWEWQQISDYDVEFVQLSKDGRLLVWSENHDGASKLFARDLQTNFMTRMPDLPMGVIKAMTLASAGDRLAVIFDRATHAPTLIELNLRTGAITELTQSMLGGIDPTEMIEPELVRFPTFDGRETPAWLFRPRSAAPAGGYPAVMSIHGGPETQERPEYLHLGLYQYLASRGIMVLCPNVRGSTGYGVTYEKLIRRDWGGDDLKDIEAAAQYLQKLPDVNRERIGLYGRSYGGFAILSAAARLPQYWRAAVDVVGVSNLVTFLRSAPAFWKTFLKTWLGDPDEDAEFLIQRSPITYADQVRCPMLVIQGAKDPRVVKAESDQMVEKMRAAGVDVTYYVDEHSGHMPTRRENYFQWIKMTADFLERHLLA
jgi:dipeptidyl aminopeptidase/acylaminoacyl peptidase